MPNRIRRLRVRHTTKYSYDRPIARSLHRLHLRPIDDWKQTVVAYQLKTSPRVQEVEYEDVFGNWTTRFEINKPYKTLTITAESLVEVQDVDPFAFAKLPIRPPSFPLVWMPWERTMLQPYLSPDELPETELRELYDYAMGFVKRNKGDLMETLFAINLALFREYQYVPGCTTLETTAYDVMCQRRGVCQDFSNLFITLARLLGIPARYVCGYLFTGNGARQGSRASSDASHAWVQLYIPNIGWKGFDPTNGTLPVTDHVRVAYGRHYLDATPTAGTLYTPAQETLSTEVEVIDAAAPPPPVTDAA
jgi:transglutaminase-like putative cysteine protease